MKFFSSKSKKFSNNLLKKYQKKLLFKPKLKKKNSFIKELIDKYKINRYSSFISNWTFLYINGYLENRGKESLYPSFIKTTKVFEKPKIIFKTKILPKEIKKIYIGKNKYKLKYISQEKPIINLTTKVIEKENISHTTNRDFIKSELVIQREIRDEAIVKELENNKIQYKDKFTNLINEIVKEKINFINQNTFLKRNMTKSEYEKLFTSQIENKFIELKSVIQREEKDKLITREIEKQKKDIKYKTFISKNIQNKYKLITNNLIKPYLIKNEIEKLKREEFTKLKTKEIDKLEYENVIQKESIEKEKTFKEVKNKELIINEVFKNLESKIEYKDKFTNLVNDRVKEKLNFINKNTFLKQNVINSEYKKLFTSKIESKFIELKSIVQKEEKESKYKTLTIENVKDRYKYITNNLLKPYLIKSEIEKLRESELREEIIEKERRVKDSQFITQKEIKKVKDKKFIINEVFKNLENKFQYRDKFTSLISERVREKLNFINQNVFLRERVTKSKYEKLFTSKVKSEFIELKPIIQREVKKLKEQEYLTKEIYENLETSKVEYRDKFTNLINERVKEKLNFINRNTFLKRNVKNSEYEKLFTSKVKNKLITKEVEKYKILISENIQNKYKLITSDLLKPYLIKREVEKLRENELREIIEKEQRVKESQLITQREVKESKEQEYLTKEVYENLEKDRIQYKDKFTNLINEKLNFINRNTFLNQDVENSEYEKLFTSKVKNKLITKEVEKYKILINENIQNKYKLITSDLLKPYLIKREVEKLRENELREITEKEKRVKKSQFIIQREVKELEKDKIQYRDKFTNLVSNRVREKIKFINQTIFLNQDVKNSEYEKLFTSKIESKFIELKPIVQREEKDKLITREIERQKKDIKYKTLISENIQNKHKLITNDLVKPYLIKSEIEKLKREEFIKLKNKEINKLKYENIIQKESIEKEKTFKELEILIQKDIKELKDKKFIINEVFKNLESKIQYKDKFTNLINEKLNFINRNTFLNQDVKNSEYEKLFTSKVKNKLITKEVEKYKILINENIQNKYKLITSDLLKPYLIKREVEKLRENELREIIEKEQRVKESQLITQREVKESKEQEYLTKEVYENLEKDKIQYRDKFTNLISERVREKIKFINQTIFLKRNVKNSEYEKLFTSKIESKFIELKPIVQREEKESKYKTLTIENVKDKYNFITNNLIKPYIIKNEIEKLKREEFIKLKTKETDKLKYENIIQKKAIEKEKDKEFIINEVFKNLESKIEYRDKFRNLINDRVKEKIKFINQIIFLNQDVKKSEYEKLFTSKVKNKLITKEVEKYKTLISENIKDRYKLITKNLVKPYLIKSEVEKLRELKQQQLIEKEKTLIQKEEFLQNRVLNSIVAKSLYEKVKNDNSKFISKIKVNREVSNLFNTLENFDVKVKKEIVNLLNVKQKSTLLAIDRNRIYSNIKSLSKNFLSTLLSNKKNMIKEEVFNLTDNLISKYNLSLEEESRVIKQISTIKIKEVIPQENRVISAKAYRDKMSQNSQMDMQIEVEPKVIKEREIEYIEAKESVDLEVNKIDVLVNIENKLDELALKIYRQLKDEINLEYVRNGL